MSGTSFLSVYNLANLTAPASGVTHGAKWQVAIVGGETVRLNMLSQQEFLGVFLGQSMQVDNTANASQVTIMETTYGWIRIVAAGALVTFQYPAVQNQNFIFSCPDDVLFGISIFDWPAFPDYGTNTSGGASSSVTILGQPIEVTDLAAEASLATLQPAVTLTSRSTTTVAATSTALMGANAARKYLLIAAPQTADVWVNPLGGTAGIGLADCFRIASGGSYESGAYVWNGAITYFCATGSLELPAVEGA